MGRHNGPNGSKKQKRVPDSDSSGGQSTLHDVSNVLSDSRRILYGERTDVQGDIQRTSTPTQAPSRAPRVTFEAEDQNPLPPPWADAIFNCVRSLTDKVDHIAKRLDKLENVESKVTSFEKNLADMRAEIKEGLKKTKEIVTMIEERTDHMEFQMGEMDDRVKSLESKNDQLKQDLADLKARSMRDNLVFSHIPEAENETPDVTERILRQFMGDKLKMSQEQVDSVKFDRVHRIAGQEKPRAIVAKFHEFKQRQDVKMRSKELKGTRFYINEQFPPEVHEQRKELLRVMKSKRDEGHRVRLVYNKLYIDNVLYKPAATRPTRTVNT